MRRCCLKRFFDLSAALLGVLITFPLIFIARLWVAARENGFSLQDRVGRHGKMFWVVKIKTMYPEISGERSTISLSTMRGITRSGYWLRKFKIDELPQLWNVLIGEVGLVGPQPDVAGAIAAGNDPVQEAGCGMSAEPENSRAIAEAVLHLCSLNASTLEEKGKAGQAYVMKNHIYPVLADKFLRAVSPLKGA